MMRFFQLFAIATSVFSVSSFGAISQEAPAQVTLPAITVVAVEKRIIDDTVYVSGLITPVEQVQVAPLIEGQPIEELLVDIGDQVTAGQVLARLSSSTLMLQKAQLAASLASAKALIAQADAQMIEAQSASDEALRVSKRTQILFEQGTAPQATLDKAISAAVSATSRLAVATQSLAATRANLALVDAQTANLDLQLARTDVKAPVSGEITARNAQIGVVASAGAQPMFTIIRDSSLELRADVAEADISRLMVGQSVTLRLSASAQAITGTVRLVEPTIDLQTRQGRIRVQIDAGDDTSNIVRPGMFAEAAVLVSSREVLALPVTSIGQRAEQTQAMQVIDGQASLKDVQTGVRDNGWVEVVTGLNLGDTVVAKAGAFVRDGDKINPVVATAPTN
jgi:HlyD family secretion protein